MRPDNQDRQQTTGAKAAGGKEPRERLELSCDRERIALIFNPAAGPGNASLRRAQIERFLQRAGLACEITDTTLDRGAGALAREAIERGVERVIVSGGDGSVMEAAGALLGTGVALGIVPGGTGNLFAINLRIPTDVEQALRLALTGRPTPIDVGCCNGTPFVMLAGMGLDARMIRDADRKLKKRLGPLAYFWVALRNLTHPSVLYRIRIDGRVLRRRAKSVMVANLGRITGGLEFIPDSQPRDGLLEVAVLRAESLPDFAGLVWSALRGRMREDPRLETFRGREILVETARPEPLQLDGNDAGTTTRAEFRILDAALNVVLE